jgi:hypothetical protein
MTHRYALLLLLALPTVGLRAQNPVVAQVIDAMRIDSMIKYVEELSGEVPVDVGNGPEPITSRHKNAPGNALAQAYIQQKLVQFGYTPVVQAFSVTGHNVLASKPGVVYPDRQVILCAHYDAMPGGISAAPAADDDGSGTAALLEAARVLKDIPFEYTLTFAFWDEEEQGLVGSAFAAGALASNDALVHGVVNMDAIAYDGNGDKKARVHARPIANSLAIADTVFAVLNDHGIDIDLILTNPGATYSDHASFWNEGYGAVLMIEEFTGDGNPYYHTMNDKVEHFDVPYYEKLAKLSVGSAAAFAVPYSGPQSVQEVPVAGRTTVSAYPNPTSENVGLWLDVTITGRHRVALLDAFGRELELLHDGLLAAGKHAFNVPLSRYAAGTYCLQVATPADGSEVLRLVRTP